MAAVVCMSGAPEFINVISLCAIQRCMKTPTPASGIYGIMNLNNQKIYVGSSQDIKQRIQKHRAVLRGNYHQNARLQNSYNKHGEEAFYVFVIEQCSGNLTEREQFWLDILKPEYNFTQQVVRNVLCQESRDKISATLKKRFADGMVNPRKGVTLSDYTKELISKSSTGRIKSQKSIEQQRQKMLGRKKSPEHLANNGEARKQLFLLTKDEERLYLRGIVAVENFLGIPKGGYLKRKAKQQYIINGYAVKQCPKT